MNIYICLEQIKENGRTSTALYLPTYANSFDEAKDMAMEALSYAHCLCHGNRTEHCKVHGKHAHWDLEHSSLTLNLPGVVCTFTIIKLEEWK